MGMRSVLVALVVLFLGLLEPAAQATSAPPPRKHAFLAGFGSFASDTYFPPLPHASEDLARMAHALRAIGFQFENMSILADKDVKSQVASKLAGEPGVRDLELLDYANIGALLQALNSFARNADGADAAIVYLSGHGGVAGAQRFFALPDSTLESGSTLAIADVVDKMRPKNIGAKLLLADTCAAQGLEGGANAQGGNAEVGSVNRFFSSRFGTKSYFDESLGGTGASVFTWFFVEALNPAARRAVDRDGNHRATLEEVAAYVETGVSSWSKASVATQPDRKQVPSKVIVTSIDMMEYP